MLALVKIHGYDLITRIAVLTPGLSSGSEGTTGRYFFWYFSIWKG